MNQLLKDLREAPFHLQIAFAACILFLITIFVALVIQTNLLHHSTSTASFDMPQFPQDYRCVQWARDDHRSFCIQYVIKEFKE